MDYFSLSKVKQNVFKQKKKREEEVGLKSSSFFMGVKVFPAATGGWGGGRCPSSGGRLRASSAEF